MNQIEEPSLHESELVHKLSEFGLSSDEATIFYLLTRVRKSGLDWVTGKDLAKIAQRDRVRIYQILQKLQMLGLIRANFSRPTGYSAVTAETAIERLIAIHQAKLNQLNSDEAKLEEALRRVEPIEGISEQFQTEIEQNKQTVSFFHGVSGIQHLIRDAVAAKSLKIIANDKSIEYILSTIDNSLQRPKSCKVIFSGSQPTTRERLSLNQKVNFSFENSFIQADLPTFIVSDSQVIVLFYSIEKYKPKPLSSLKSRLVMLHALVVNDTTYVEEMHQLFDTLWQMSISTRVKSSLSIGEKV